MGLYSWLEEKYYSLMDFIQEKLHVPVVDWFVKPIEEHGIPSFPVAVLLLLAVVAGAWFLLAGGAPSTATLSITAQSQGELLDGVKITLLAANGSVLGENTTVDGKTSFAGLPLGAVSLKATKTGFETLEKNVDLSASRSLLLELKTEVVEAPTPTPAPTQWNLQDPGNETPTATLIIYVKGKDGVGIDAVARVYDKDSNAQLGDDVQVIGGTGTLDLKAGEKIYVTAEADGYVAYDGSDKTTLLRAGNNVLSIQMTPANKPFVPATCGNGAIDVGEECDGNANLQYCGKGANGCSTSCTCTYAAPLGTCGNNVLENGEYCDGVIAGSLCGVTAIGCLSNCKCNYGSSGPSCGNGVIDSGEQCESTNTSLCGPTVIGCTSCRCTYPAQNSNTTVITVIDENNNTVSGARVRVFNASNPLATLSEKYTDASGKVSFELALSATFYATADDAGYFMGWTPVFVAGQSLNVSITTILPSTSASLTANVVRVEDGAPVGGVNVGVYFTVFSQTILLGNAQTDALGNATFNGLKKGLIVSVNGSLGARQAGEQITALTNDSNKVNLVLQLASAKLIVSAFDMVSGKPIPNAVFNASFLNSSVVCSGSTCNLTVPAEVEVTTTATAPNYSVSTMISTLIPNEERAINFSLIDLRAVNDSVINLTTVIDADTGLPVTSFKLGHTYTLVFNVWSSYGDYTGVHISLDNAGAWITGSSPVAGDEKGSPSLENAACVGLEDVDYSGGWKYKWIDLTYYSANASNYALVLKVNVSIDANTPLNATTQSADLNVRYRSWITRSNKYIRNPFDATLGASAGTPLASGCNAASFAQKFLIMSPATTCNDYSCITMTFSQGDRVGPNEGFPANSVLNLLEGDTGFEPMLVGFKIEVFKDLYSSNAPQIVFTLDSANARATNLFVSVDGADSTNPGRRLCGGESIEVSTTPASLGSPFYTTATVGNQTVYTVFLGDLTSCLNYMPPSVSGKPFVLTGNIFVQPLEATDRTIARMDFKADYDENGTQTPGSTTHETWFSVQSSNVAASAFAVAELQFFQVNGTADVGQDVWDAQGIADCLKCPNNLTNCSDSIKAFDSANCPYGLVEMRYRITILRPQNASGTEQHSFYLRTTPDFIKLKERGAWYKITFSDGSESSVYTPMNWFVEGFNENVVESLQAGDVISGTALAYALKQGHTKVYFGHSITDSATGINDEVKLEREVFVSTQPVSSIISFTDPSVDNCKGTVDVAFDSTFPSQDQFHLKNACTNLVMRVSTVFPADAVPTSVETPGTVLIRLAGGDVDAAGCFESCPYVAGEEGKTVDYEGCTPGFDSAFGSPGKWVLRYNTWLDSCPTRFKPTANLINGANLTLELKYASSPYPLSLNILVIGQENVPCTTKINNDTGELECYPKEICMPFSSDENNYCVWKASYADCTPSNTKWFDANWRNKNCVGYLTEYTGIKSLYVAPLGTWYIMSPTGNGVFQRRFPQLWVIDNKMQGPRDIYVYERGDESDIQNFKSEGLMDSLPVIHFDGPGAVVFAYTPREGRKMVVYENRRVLGYTGNAPESLADKNGPIKLLSGESEYVEALLGKGLYSPVTYPLNTDMGAFGPQITETDTLNILRMNAFYLKEVAEVLIGGAQRTANLTAYWRSQGATKWCYCTQTGDVSTDENGAQPALLPKSCKKLSFTDFTNPSICRDSIDDWRALDANLSRVAHGCTVCNNTAQFVGKNCAANYSDQLALGRVPCTFNSNVPTYSCDDRCVAETTAAGVQVSSSFVDYCEVTSATYCGLHVQPSGTECPTASKPASIPTMNTITQANVATCASSGACALLLDEKNVPYCFADQNADGFLTDADYANPALSVTPATLSGSTYSCPGGEIIAVHDSCNVPCSNPCVGSTSCRLDCDPSEGAYYTWESNATIQTGWLSPADWVPANASKMPVHPVSIQQTNQSELWHIPFAYFSANPQFSYPIPLVSHQAAQYGYKKQETFYELNTVKKVNGCTSSPNYAEQGVYELDVKNDIDAFKATGQEQWTGTANSMKLPQANYLGSKCVKKTGAQGALELCAPIWLDFAGGVAGAQFAACINSGSSYAPDDPRSTYKYLGQYKSIVSSDSKVWFETPNGYKVAVEGIESQDNSSSASGKSSLDFAGSTPASSTASLLLVPASNSVNRISFAGSSTVSYRQFLVWDPQDKGPEVIKVPLGARLPSKWAPNWWTIVQGAVTGAYLGWRIGGMSWQGAVIGAVIGAGVGYIAGTKIGTVATISTWVMRAGEAVAMALLIAQITGVIKAKVAAGKNKAPAAGAPAAGPVAPVAPAAGPVAPVAPAAGPVAPAANGVTIGEAGKQIGQQIVTAAVPPIVTTVVNRIKNAGTGSKAAGKAGDSGLRELEFADASNSSSSTSSNSSSSGSNLLTDSTSQAFDSGMVSIEVMPGPKGFVCQYYRGVKFADGVLGTCANSNLWIYSPATLDSSCRPAEVWEVGTDGVKRQLTSQEIQKRFTGAACAESLSDSGSTQQPSTAPLQSQPSSQPFFRGRSDGVV